MKQNNDNMKMNKMANFCFIPIIILIMLASGSILLTKKNQKNHQMIELIYDVFPLGFL